MVKAAQRFSNLKLIDGDEEIYAELADGFYLVRLLTPSALDRESAQMQHCIGLGAYDKELNVKGNLYLSLRDQQGKAHVTMEIKCNVIVQLQGKQNRVPLKKYLNLLIPFFKKQKFKVEVPASILGHVVDASFKWHSIEALPAGLAFDCKVDLSDTELKSLPEGLVFERALYLRRSPLTCLPKDIKLGGSVDLSMSQLTTLNEGMRVGGHLFWHSFPSRTSPMACL